MARKGSGIMSGGYLGVNDYLVSDDNSFFAIMQSDARFVIYRGSGPQARVKPFGPPVRRASKVSTLPLCSSMAIFASTRGPIACTREPSFGTAALRGRLVCTLPSCRTMVIFESTAS
jgi:hypothetical protein